MNNKSSLNNKKTKSVMLATTNHHNRITCALVFEIELI